MAIFMSNRTARIFDLTKLMYVSRLTDTRALDFRKCNSSRAQIRNSGPDLVLLYKNMRSGTMKYSQFSGETQPQRLLTAVS